MENGEWFNMDHMGGRRGQVIEQLVGRYLMNDINLTAAKHVNVQSKFTIYEIKSLSQIITATKCKTDIRVFISFAKYKMSLAVGHRF